MQLHLKYLTDATGTKTDVMIPFKEWKMLTDDYKHLQQCETLKSEFSDAFNEIVEIEKGNKKAVTLQEFLHEC